MSDSSDDEYLFGMHHYCSSYDSEYEVDSDEVESDAEFLAIKEDVDDIEAKIICMQEKVSELMEAGEYEYVFNNGSHRIRIYVYLAMQ